LSALQVLSQAPDALGYTANFSNNFDLSAVASVAFDPTAVDVQAAFDTERQSITVMTGEQGDEIADYTKNLKKGSTDLKIRLR